MILLTAGSNVVYVKPVFTARRYACAVYADVMCPFVRLSVYHKPALYQNG